MGLFYRFGPWETPSRAASKLLNDEVAPDRASATDGLIAGWVQKLKQNPQDGDGWTSLGEAFMQKGRESLDVRYYGRAQTAFDKALALR